MAIKVGNYSFTGPFTSSDNLENRSGIYAIHCRTGNTYYLIDIGESSDVKNRVENHDRKECWTKNCRGTITVSACYTPGLQQPERILVEQELRKLYNPKCEEK